MIMKRGLHIILAAAFILTLTMGCTFSRKENLNTNQLTEKSETSYQLAKKALKYIQGNKVDSFKNLTKFTTQDKIDFLMREGKSILDNFEYPIDSLVTKSRVTNYTASGKQIVDSYTFPFHYKLRNDSVKYFDIVIINNEITGFNITEDPPFVREQMRLSSQPHQKKFHLQTKNLTHFRIWYDGGKGNVIRYKNKIGLFAVSGDLEELNRIGIKNKFQHLFDLINAVKFDSLDYRGNISEPRDDSEFIYLRLSLDNDETYKDFVEFDISYIIKAEPGKTELLADYIELKHNSDIRYLLKKNKNPEIVKTLVDIARFNYGNNMEENP